MTPPTDRMLIWRMAKRTLVSVRHAYQPKRPSGFRALAGRRDSRVMEAIVLFPLDCVEFEPEWLSRGRSDRGVSGGQAVLEVGNQVVDVFEPN